VWRKAGPRRGKKAVQRRTSQRGAGLRINERRGKYLVTWDSYLERRVVPSWGEPSSQTQAREDSEGRLFEPKLFGKEIDEREQKTIK